ncbi:Uncharacterized protein APZ42_029784 [Daphnia magna]|uniref:Cuticle protein n=1 Tax=Daphnia magna TaxID=35525 RepID=A0A162D487_9CRUS|nr:Uncharacterized protein APZ42_029784 [Daphnia magna]
MVSLKVIVLLAMASRALALPVGNLPRNSKERASPKEEPVVPRDYAFNYDIQDGFVGMTHARSEVQRNGVIRGFYRYSRPDGILVTVTYTADETGFHPVITEEKAPNLRSSSAVHTMYSSDNAELMKITLTEDDAQLARPKSETALLVTTSNPGPRVQLDSQNSDRQIVSRSESISQPIDQQIARWSRTINPETVVSAVNSQSRFD